MDFLEDGKNDNLQNITSLQNMHIPLLTGKLVATSLLYYPGGLQNDQSIPTGKKTLKNKSYA